ncbi:hypothetical protein TraAM80_09934 [Trypanosoma rangeli]|uniref:Uncharacterized protein n=1 Tax=Trypanosoma rangeli TaxID=5698 RepID=A0A422MSI0_TRYRA|nr:uncharacterized protein TraAM80_09934 [Trypanosoma rangeli]RNE96176.1 hypothetical protein TraAM80_09934 [Trypanosoma rangeli]|eukprot:RNE96176.1 hypothetical protein TraAM80_09934 [Trypanosoma rangeli]
MDEDYDTASLQESVRRRFLLVLAQLLPPCASTAAQPTALASAPFSAHSPVVLTAVKSLASADEGGTEDVEGGGPIVSFAWPDDCDDEGDASRRAEIVALLLTGEMGVGGQLFNVCVDIFERQPPHQHSSLRLLLHSTLSAVLTNYRCDAAHAKREVALDEASTSSPPQESDCALTSLLRTAAAMVAINKSWWATTPGEEDFLEREGSSGTAMLMSNADRLVEGLCDFVVAVAQQVTVGKGNAYTFPPVCCSRALCKRRRESVCKGTFGKERWFAAMNNDSFPQLQEVPSIAEVFQAKSSLGCAAACSGSNNRNSGNGEALSEIGNALAVINEACKARTVPDMSPWQYGRNRITLASLTVITQQVPEHDTATEESEQMTMAERPVQHDDSNTNNDNSTSDYFVHEDGTHELLGYFLHETGTLYTTRGGRYLMEID